MGDEPIKNDKKLYASKLLLAEHKYLGDSFWKNEESGETKVRFFISLVAAVLTAIGTLLTITIQKEIYNFVIIPILIFALFSLLMFGIVTLLRILKRNEAADSYKKGMDEVRERFKKYFDESGVLSGYKPFGGPKNNKRIRKIGGLAHIVSVLNSLIIAALTCIIIFEVNLKDTIDGYINENIYKILFFLFFVFFVSFLMQYYYAKCRDKQSKKIFLD